MVHPASRFRCNGRVEQTDQKIDPRTVLGVHVDGSEDL